MKKIWEFFENLGESVYAADAETYEMLYMNRRAMELYGIKDYAGRKCYEVLQKCSAPCAVCNNRKLVEGQFTECQYFNPTLGKYFMLKDTVVEEDGRRIRMEIAIDASDRENQRTKLGKYENLEAMVNNCIRFASHEPDPDKSLNILLEFLGIALKGERAYIFEKNETGGDDNTYEWTAAGVTPEKDNLQNLPAEVCANWYRNFSENRSIAFSDLEDMRDSDPLQYYNLKRQGIHSIVVVPIYDNKQAIGFFGIDNPPEQNLDYARNLLQIVGYFILSTLKRRNLVNQLRELSYRDQLTEIGNRHAMERWITKKGGSGHIGVVYGDITGLKRKNDTEGHEAGDRLICDAADCFKRAFGEYAMFRIGGDELLALCAPIDEAELYSRVELLKNYTAEKAVNIAVGAVWREQGGNDVHKLMSEAEKIMYDEKSEYYLTSGIERRR